MLEYQYPVEPMALAFAIIPLVGLLLDGRRLTGAVPDMIFAAIAGGIIGDALTDAVDGFFEGGAAEWLLGKGIEESREAVTLSLGKMSGCLLGAGLILSLALAAGIRPDFL